MQKFKTLLFTIENHWFGQMNEANVVANILCVVIFMRKKLSGTNNDLVGLILCSVVGTQNNVHKTCAARCTVSSSKNPFIACKNNAMYVRTVSQGRTWVFTDKLSGAKIFEKSTSKVKSDLKRIWKKSGRNQIVTFSCRLHLRARNWGRPPVLQQSYLPQLVWVRHREAFGWSMDVNP